VPVALALWERNRWAGAAWTAIFVARPILWPPWGQQREYGWSPLDHVVGNAYLLAALAFSIWAAVGLKTRDGSPATRTDAESTSGM
jgi:alpha-1,2-mannosyltransferase